MTVGIVVVSHSRALAEAAVALAGEMLQDGRGPIEVAAGLDDGGFGTDAIAISEAVARADQGDGVVVLMDMGSAVLSAELALEMVDDDVRERVVLTPAPLVEGLVLASVSAAGRRLGRGRRRRGGRRPRGQGGPPRPVLGPAGARRHR